MRKAREKTVPHGIKAFKAFKAFSHRSKCQPPTKTGDKVDTAENRLEALEQRVDELSRLLDGVLQVRPEGKTLVILDDKGKPQTGHLKIYGNCRLLTATESDSDKGRK